MMYLDVKLGVFQFENWTFIPSFTLQELELHLPMEGVELWSSHSQWKSYRLKIVKDLIVVVMFNDGIIENITLFPILETYAKNTYALNSLLNTLGGEQNYPWGRVEYSVDPKAGFESIAIRYRR